MTAIPDVTMDVTTDNHTTGTADPNVLPVHFIHPEFVYIRTIGACVFALIGCPLNVTALVVILKSGSSINTQGRLVTYLCIIETLICIWALPVFAYDQWTMAGLHHPLFCKMNVFISFALQSNVPFAFLLIALHRFLLVVRPVPSLINLGGSTGSVASIVGGVLLVFVFLIPPLFDAGAVYRQSEITGICTSLIRPHTKLYNSISQGLLLFVPLALMCTSYGLILRTVRQQNRRIAAANADILDIPEVRESMRNRTYVIRVTLLSAIAVLMFTVTYTPFILGTLFPSHLDTYVYSAIATVTVFSHTVTSPLVYVCGDTEMRKTFVRIFKWRWCERSRDKVVSVYLPPETPGTHSRKVEAEGEAREVITTIAINDKPLGCVRDDVINVPDETTLEIMDDCGKSKTSRPDISSNSIVLGDFHKIQEIGESSF